MRKNRVRVGLGLDDKTLRLQAFKPAFVLKLMTHNYAYDIQCEGDRAWYAYRVFTFSRHKGKVLKDFRAYLLAIPDDLGWADKDHAIAVVVRLWKGGHFKRKEIIQVILHHYHLEEHDQMSLAPLLKLGKKGIRLYINQVGKSHAVEKYSDYYPYEERNIRLLKLLKRKGIKGHDLSKSGAAFIRDLKKWKREPYVSKPRFLSFKAYLAYVSENRFRGRATKFFQSFNPSQVKILVRRLKKVSNPDFQYGLLAPLVELGLHKPVSLFLELTDSKDKQVRQTAGRILAKTKSGKVRKRALQMIRSSVDLRGGIEMLSSNFEVEDDALIRNKLEGLSSKHDLHDCGYGLLSAVKICGPSLLAESLSYIYLNSRCSLCRKRIFVLLETSGHLSESEVSAARYDAYEGIRSYAKSLR